MTGRRSLRLLLATATGIARRAAATHRANLIEQDVIRVIPELDSATARQPWPS